MVGTWQLGIAGCTRNSPPNVKHFASTAGLAPAFRHGDIFIPQIGQIAISLPAKTECDNKPPEWVGRLCPHLYYNEQHTTYKLAKH